MDGLLLRTGLHGIGTSSIAVTTTGNLEVRSNLQPHFSSVGRSQQLTTVASAASSSSTISVGEGIPVTTAATSKFSFRYPFRSLLPWVNNKPSSTMRGVALDDAVLADSARREGNGDRGEKPEHNEVVDFEDSKALDVENSKGRNGNWVFQILRVKSLWSEEAGTEKQTEVDENSDSDLDLDLDLGGDDQQIDDSASSSGCGGEEDEFCEACQSGYHKEFDRDSFSKLLKKVPLSEAKLYAQLSYLGNLAYDIPSIKQRNLLKRHRLRYVTSSIEKREQMMDSLSDKKEEEEDLITTNTTSAKAEQTRTTEKLDTTTCTETEQEHPAEEQKNGADDHGPRISAAAAAAFHIAASAASFLNTRTRGMLFSASESVASGGEEHEDHELGGGGEEEKGQGNSKGGVVRESSDMDMASLMATTDSVTAVVSAKEEVKQAVADDLSSVSSAPCEWYTCDDERSATRFFVIQGSESVASWQANLLFEPTEFEDLGVYVHRGIYEAAKGMYQQMLPEIQTHIQSHGPNAKFRFTGHSLGGSLSLLINLMLLIRGDVPTVGSLLPVVTFGSPCVMCGGDNLLKKLGLRKNHIQAITMHRDIVPRAFSCHYPNHVAEILKAINGNFRNHPCLNQEHKLLFAPMGELVILQPDSSLSPQHDLLPEESGMYVLTCDEEESGAVVAAAERSFLNTPHPLEILSDRGAYGNGGTIQRDHDMNSYLRCVRTVIRKELNRIRKVERERRRKVWWPMVTPRVVSGGGMLVGRGPRSTNYNWQGMVSESFKRRFSRLVASQHMHMLVVFLFPAKLLLVGVHSVLGFR